MFIKKQPCRLPRVLPEELCPPPDGLHSPSEYPTYYSPLYFPHLYPEVFSTHEGVSAWVKTMIVVELGPLLPVSNIVGSYINECFTIDLNGTDCIPLLASDIFEAHFSVSMILQCSPSPAWLTSPGEHLSQSLSTLDLPTLRSSIAQANQFAVQLTPPAPAPTSSRVSKADSIRALITLFDRYRHTLQQLPHPMNTCLSHCRPSTCPH
jgi:hypothetical protein